MTFEIRTSQDRRQPYYWRAVADNGQVLATSETYTTRQSCEHAIAMVKRQAASARVTDFTRTLA